MMVDSLTRILYINPAGERGGAETVLLNILRHLDRQRFQATVVCLQDGAFVNELREQSDVDVEVVPMGRFRSLSDARRVIQRLQDIIHRDAIDLVHANGTGAHLYGGLAAKRGGVPSLYHMHDLIAWEWSRQGLIHLLALAVPATATLAVSHYAAKRFQQAWPTSRPIDVIHNSIALDHSENPAARAGICREFAWPADSPLVVWCGRLQRWKGTHVFINAAALVKQQAPNARFLVVGGTLFGLDDDYRKELHDLAGTLGLNDNLHFTGHQTDARRFLAAADVVVHSSVTPDPFGLVVLEAMALGKPAIASAEGGPTEMIQYDVSGFLSPPGDARALAQFMLRLLDDEDLRTRMGRAARARVEQHFTVQQMMQKLESLYRRLTNRAQPVARAFASTN